MMPISPDGGGTMCSWMLTKSLVKDWALLRRLSAVGFIICALGVFRAFADPGAGIFVIRYAGYWLTLALVLLLMIRMCGAVLTGSHDFLTEVKAHRAAWIVALAGSVVWQVNEPRRFKVLFDEHGYVGIAQTMHLEREAAYPARLHYFEGEGHVLNYGVDKRPVLFPFLVSIAHDITGFRTENAFYVNAALGMLSFLLVYYLLLRLSVKRIALCGQAIWFGLPLLAQVATGGGYDLLNICLLMGWLLAVLRYLDGDGGAGDEMFLVGIAVALAQVRNESILYLVGTGMIVWWKWLRRGRATLSWHSVLFLLFLILPVAANVVFSKLKGMKETAPGQDFFSLSYAPENLAGAVGFVFNPDLEGMNSSLLGYAGVISLLLFIVGYIKKGLEDPRSLGDVDKALLVFAAMVACSFIVYMCTFWGSWTDPVVSRFSLPVWLLFLVMTARVAMKALKGRGDIHAGIPAMLFVWAFCMGIPASAQAKATHMVMTGRERLFLEEKLEETSPGDVLLIVNSPLMSAVGGYAVTGIEGVNSSPWKVQAVLDLKLYKEVWVAERYYYNYASGIWMREEKYALTGGFTQELVASTKLGGSAEFRISRILAWRDPEEAKGKVAEAFTPRPTSRLEYFKRLVPLLP